MEIDSRDTYWTSSASCPHTHETGGPVCWDCTEEGHVNNSTRGTEEQGYPQYLPSRERLRRFRKSLGFWDAGLRRSIIYDAASQSSTLELRLPEEGLEVASPASRHSQPGLIVVTGPRVVSPEEKFSKPEPTIWNSDVKTPPKDNNDDDDDAAAAAATTTTTVIASRAVSSAASTTSSESDTRIWGLRRRTFKILIILTVLVIVGIIIGIAVGVTQQKKTHSTSHSTSVDGKVSSSSPSMPSMVVTETVSLEVTSRSSTFITLLKTQTPSSSSTRQTPKPTAKTATGGRGSTDSETAVVATVFVTQPPPSPTDTIPSQPTSTTSTADNAPSSPKNTAPASPPPPSPAILPASSPAESPADTPADSPTDSSSTDSPSSRICIGDDGSTYTDPATGDKFRLECSVAHQGKDILNYEANTMQDCIAMCAKNTHCKGAIWFNVGPQGTLLNYCWLKSEMDSGDGDVNGDAQSVVRL
ncbi:hypothetical protein F5Y01DRAFT_315735 [Xylaria sp. FL0043]|nr:hypothetical protein F5Y01DRAFT_315735 [Xylaria sp. FL0043]